MPTFVVGMRECRETLPGHASAARAPNRDHLPFWSDAASFSRRRGMTLLELTIAMTVMVMVIGALGALAHTVQQGYEYSQGYGVATQHARVALDRIATKVCRATANANFPGCIVVPETVNSCVCPDTLAIWLPSGAAADPDGLPRYHELVIYCPNPDDPRQLIELTAPADARTTPAADDLAAWQTQLAALKTASTSKRVVLTSLLRTCLTSAADGKLCGAARFAARLRPSADDWAGYTAGSATWMNLPWAQGVYGSTTGLRQVWVRMELQLIPGVEWNASNPAAAQPMPFFGSAALYYTLSHP